MIKYLPGPSQFWRCPACSTVLQKQSQPIFGNATVTGTVGCGNCGNTVSRSDVYGEKYDLAEVELICPHCHTQLRGPKDDLLGLPCPACGRSLPEEKTIADLRDLKDSNVDVYRVGSDGEIKKSSVAAVLGRESARQIHEKAVTVMDRGDYRSAIALFKEVLRATAEDPDPMTYLNIAVCHAHMGEFKQSLTVLEDAMRLWPDNTRLRLNYEAIKRDAR